MKDYPSIPHLSASGLAGQSFHTFAKVDGSCLRAQWNPKRGFYKFGSRNQLIDPQDPILGPAIPLFLATLAEPLGVVARNLRWQDLVVFLEYAGPRSFAGSHVPGDEMALYVIDAAADRQGILGPQRFLEVFGGHPIPMPAYLGQRAWDVAFITQVQEGALPGMSFEGVVGKQGDRHHLVMVKSKSAAWIEAVRARYGAKAETLI